MNTTIDISKRTGGEWKVCGANQDQIFSVDSLGKMRICETDGASEEQRANAAFIVTACNNFDAMLEALKGAKGALNRLIEKYNPDDIEAEWISEIHEAILNAEK